MRQLISQLHQLVGTTGTACVTMQPIYLRHLQIPVPSITPSASRWSWDPEEERKRQEKWQKEQERLLQVHKGTLGKQGR